MTALEKAAKALWDAREAMMPGLARMRWEDGTGLAREATVYQTRAVLMAVRDLDQPMRLAGLKALLPPPGDVAVYETLHHAMIDAILSEEAVQ